MAGTIKEIAARLGISRGTVDRALHNRPGVNADIAQRVREEAQALGYVPNRAGRSLAARKQPLKIGCMLAGIGNPFFACVTEGFLRAAAELADFGVQIEIAQVQGYEPAVHVQAIEGLVEKGCAALCIATVDVNEVRACVGSIIARGIPVVTVNTDISFTNRLMYSGCDYIKCGRTAAGLLCMMMKQHLAVLIVTGSRRVKGHSERIEGFLETLREKKMDYTLVGLIEAQDDETLAYTHARLALQSHPAINCVYIAAAGTAGVCRAVLECRAENKPIVIAHDLVPETQRLIEAGVIDFTICQEAEKQGYAAVRAVFDYFMEGRTQKRHNLYTDTVIVISENM